jgi:hypothetical protein
MDYKVCPIYYHSIPANVLLSGEIPALKLYFQKGKYLVTAQNM